MDANEAIARESIRDLVARYNASGDSGRFDRLIELFAPDATMEVGGRVHSGHEEIMTIFTGTRDRWADELNPKGSTVPNHHIRHAVATHQIDFDDATHARGYAYYSVIMPHGLDHWGRYFDRYEERDGRWLFVQRRVTTDGHASDVGQQDGASPPPSS